MGSSQSPTREAATLRGDFTVHLVEQDRRDAMCVEVQLSTQHTSHVTDYIPSSIVCACGLWDNAVLYNNAVREIIRNPTHTGSGMRHRAGR